MTILLKHEYLRTRGLLGLIVGIAALVAAVGLLLAWTGWVVLAPLGMLATLVVVVGLVPAAQIALVVDYWRSSYGRMGYLTQTLPVKGSTIYGAKLVWAWLVSLLGAALSVGLFLLAWPVVVRSTGGSAAGAYGALRESWAALVEIAPAWAVAAAVVAVVAMVLIWPVQYFFAASVGSQAPMNRLGVGGPVLVFLGLYLATQVLTFVSFAAVPLAVGMRGDGLGLVRWDLFAEMAASPGGNADVMPVGFLPALFLITAICLVWTLRSWNRKVSLI